MNLSQAIMRFRTKNKWIWHRKWRKVACLKFSPVGTQTLPWPSWKVLIIVWHQKHYWTVLYTLSRNSCTQTMQNLGYGMRNSSHHKYACGFCAGWKAFSLRCEGQKPVSSHMWPGNKLPYIDRFYVWEVSLFVVWVRSYHNCIRPPFKYY